LFLYEHGPETSLQGFFFYGAVETSMQGFFLGFRVYSTITVRGNFVVLQPCAVLAVSSGALTGSSAALAVSSAALAVSSAALAGVQSRMFWTRFLITCET
jgi:hypothetical protein